MSDLFPFMHEPTAPPKSRGFTLIELMVGIALLAILLSLGVPSFNKQRQEWQRDSATKTLLAHIQQARAESIKASRQVVMCPRKSDSACEASTVKEWANGWLMFVDENADGVYKSTDNDRLILDQAGFNGLSSMEGTATSSALVFLPNGLLKSGANTITITPNNNSTKMNLITINAIGRAALSDKAQPTE